MGPVCRRSVPKKPAKVPFVRQVEASDCGAACLCMICAYYGKKISFEQVRFDCGVSRDGISIKNILEAAKQYGLSVRAFKYCAESMRTKAELPCIIIINKTHYAVLTGFRGGKALLNDPAKGYCSMTAAQFKAAFSGICVQFGKTPEFQPDIQRSTKIKRLFSDNGYFHKSIIKVFLVMLVLGIVSTLYELLCPVTFRTFTDFMLFGGNRDWFAPFFVLLLILALLLTVTEVCKALLQMRFSGKMTVISQTSFVQKLLKLPSRFFEDRSVSSLLLCYGINAEVADMVVKTAVSFVTCVITGIIFIALLFVISPMLGIMSAAAIAVSMLLRYRKSLNGRDGVLSASREKLFFKMASRYGVKYAGKLRSSGTGNSFLKIWLDYQAKVNADEIETGRSWPLSAAVLDNMTVFFVMLMTLCCALLAHGNMLSIGISIACVLIYYDIDREISSMFSALANIAMLREQMEMIHDVMDYPDEHLYSDEASADALSPLSGRIELRHIGFSYAVRGVPVINDFSFAVSPGEMIGIVGPSGCGKTTLAKLISGIYHPTRGEIWFDGRLIEEIAKENLRTCLAVAADRTLLFEGSLEDNIRMGDASISRLDVIKAAAQVHLIDEDSFLLGDIEARIAEDGSNISAGERQKIEIARALARRPSILMFDDALNSLDADVLESVIQAVRNRGITCIIFTQQISLLRGCDRAIVMDHGLKIDEGTHAELMSRCELYGELCDEG